MKAYIVSAILLASCAACDVPPQQSTSSTSASTESTPTLRQELLSANSLSDAMRIERPYMGDKHISRKMSNELISTYNVPPKTVSCILDEHCIKEAIACESLPSCEDIAVCGMHQAASNPNVNLHSECASGVSESTENAAVNWLYCIVATPCK